MLHRHGGDIYSYDNILDFSANINARGMPESVMAAARQGVPDSVRYPDPRYRSLRAALAGRENRLLGQKAYPKAEEPGQNSLHQGKKIQPEQIICGSGAAELLFSLAAALRPRHTLLAAPAFFEYERALSAFGGMVSRYYLREEEEFRLDGGFAERIQKGPHLQEGIDLIILGNPNNPTGQIIRAGALREIFGICREKKIFLVLDESFFDFLTDEDRSATLGGVEEAAGNPGLFVLKSFTKMYGMPGLRFGYGLCGGTGLLERMRSVMQPWNVSVPAQKGAEAAAAELEFARETARETAANRAWLKAELETAGYRVFPSQTNFLLFKGPEYLQDYCLERGFLIRDCSNFPGLERKDGTGFFRICVRGRQENGTLMQALREAAGICGI